MARSIYSTITVIFAVTYGAMYPSLRFFPKVWQKVLMQSDEVYTEAAVKSMEALFLQVGIVIATEYSIATYLDSLHLIDFSVVQRMTRVTPCIILTAMLGQDPLPYATCIMMFTLDGVGAVAHGSFAPGGIKGAFDRFWALWKDTPNTPLKRAVSLEAVIGFAFGVMGIIHAAIMPPNDPLSVMYILVSSLEYLWFYFAAHSPDDKAIAFVPITRVMLASSSLYISEVYGFVVLPLRMYAAAMLLGIVSPKLSAVSNGLSALYLYYTMTTHILTIENGPINWLILWGIITWIVSETVVYIYFDSYNEDQKKRLLASNWQDRILGFFVFGVGGTLASQGELGPGTVGEAVCYLLPPVTLWFSLETKMLNHMQLGTPFHPTWWANGSVSRYAPSDLINLTFSASTLLITVVLTSYAFYAILSAMGFAAFSFGEPSIRKFAGVHGIAFVLHSGLWMIVASSGIPSPGKGKLYSTFPPALPPFLQANPYDCIPVHKKDLVVGNALLFLAGFCLGDDSLGDGQKTTLKYAVFTLWGISAGLKIYTHASGWGYRFSPKVMKTD